VHEYRFVGICCDRWFVTVRQLSKISSIFITVFSLACCLVAFSSARLTALTIALDLFDPLFEELWSTREFLCFAHPSKVLHSINRWFSQRREIDLSREYSIKKTQPKISI
jgi:hypothetical protein